MHLDITFHIFSSINRYVCSCFMKVFVKAISDQVSRKKKEYGNTKKKERKKTEIRRITSHVYDFKILDFSYTIRF